MLEVATAALSPGEVILRERPLLGLPDSFDTDLDLLLNQTSLSHWDRICFVFQLLKKSHVVKSQFFSTQEVLNQSMEHLAETLQSGPFENT